MTNDKALKLALEALEFDGFTPEDATHRIFTTKAIAAIKVALAQPEQDLIPEEDLFVCGQMGAHVTRVYAQPEQESKSTIRALTEQCAALVWERDGFKKQVQQYEKNGVTCQTYRHKVEQSCDECNVNESYTTPPKRQPLTDDQFLELILRKGTQELVGVSTFVGGSIQMQGRIGLLHSAKIIKEFVEAAHNIKENT